ncbi:CAMK protein kinase [Phytophthora cinnamomi]|uniref:CAMK protein kinase n=1 Tax=Phytophthora cinnamomi TaxID=4785 RepID=UPI00355A3339|nr:CAMK protein kinase [Phytophthora cinnamomi]
MSTNRYETEASLRAAIFGEILLCRDRLTHERVVVKTVDLQLALQHKSRSQELVQENVLHEVEVLNRVRALGGHPNVINMHSYFVARGGGVLHMVLDYCEGGDLLDACVQPVTADEDKSGGSSSSSSSSSGSSDSQDNQKEDAPAAPATLATLEEPSPEDGGGPFLSGVDGSKRLHERVAHRYLVDVLSGLRFLHSHGIAHRDVSLENILLRDGRAVIADFGLCVQDPSAVGSPTGTGGSSGGGEIRCVETVGKNYYMAPEIVARERYDPRRADIWSTGIAFFILLTSSPPFERAEPSDPGFRYVAKRGIKAVFTAWGLGQDVSEPMQDLLARMLSVDPGERITMEEVWQHPVLRRPRGGACNQAD